MPVSNALYSQAEDSDLFRWMKQSDVKAFEELYNRYWPLLVNTAYKRLKNKEKSEDIVQSIFIDLYNRRSAIELTTSIKSYLYQALKFKVLNEYRSEIIRAKFKKFLFFKSGCENDFADRLEAKELDIKIKTILNGLPRKCKQVFLLSREENLSYRDISDGLNITISTVEKHISKALKSLRCQM